MIHALIFDMDGLLLDSEGYWERSRTEYCASLGCVWRPEDELTVKGNNSPEWAERIHHHCALETARDQIIAGVTARMRTLYDEHLPWLPGARETVKAVAAKYPLAIASSSPPSLIEFAMAEGGLLDLFSAIVSADGVARGKPAPDVFLAAADRLQSPAPEIAVFEDSTAGIQAARAAGMAIVAVPNLRYPPSPDALRLANLVLNSLEEFRVEMLDDLI